MLAGNQKFVLVICSTCKDGTWLGMRTPVLSGSLSVDTVLRREDVSKTFMILI